MIRYMLLVSSTGPYQHVVLSVAYRCVLAGIFLLTKYTTHMRMCVCVCVFAYACVSECLCVYVFLCVCQVVDLSAAAAANDLRPSRLTCMIRAAHEFVRNFFDQV